MTPREKVRRAQLQLAGTVALAAILWAASLAMAVVAVGGAADALLALPAAARAAIVPLAALAAIAAAGTVLWRGRAARSTTRVALWIEEHDPSLRYALVTAIDPEIAPAESHRDLYAIASTADVHGIVGTNLLQAFTVGWGPRFSELRLVARPFMAPVRVDRLEVIH